jgi:hypothetical protein
VCVCVREAHRCGRQHVVDNVEESAEGCDPESDEGAEARLDLEALEEVWQGEVDAKELCGMIHQSAEWQEGVCVCQTRLCREPQCEGDDKAVQRHDQKETHKVRPQTHLKHLLQWVELGIVWVTEELCVSE